MLTKLLIVTVTMMGLAMAQPGGVGVYPPAGGGVGAGTGDVVAAGSNVYSGSNDFSGASSMRIKIGTADPAAGDCDAAGEVGRVYLQYADPATDNSTFYVCGQTAAAGYGWMNGTYKAATAAPATCAVGQVFFDTDATAGSNWYGCTSANTWTLMGGTGASATSDLTDFKATATSTVLSIAAGGIEINSTVFSKVAATATYSSGTPNGTVRAYVDENGNIQVVGPTGLTLTCSQCTYSAAAAPTTLDGNQWHIADVVVTSGALGTVTDKRKFVNKRSILAGDGLQFDSTKTTISVDGTVLRDTDDISRTVLLPLSLGGYAATDNFMSGSDVLRTDTNSATANALDFNAAGNIVKIPTLRFVDASTTYVTVKKLLPSNYVAGTAITLRLLGLTGSGSSAAQTIRMQEETACLGDGGLAYQGVTFNAAGASTHAITTAGTNYITTKLDMSLTVTGCGPNEMILVRLARVGGDAADTLTANWEIFEAGLELTLVN